MIYLASPYSDPDPIVRHGRYLAVQRFIADVYNSGCYPGLLYSPVTYFHPIAEAHHLPTDHLWWWEVNRHTLDLSDQLWVLKLPGWRQSFGVRQEIDYWTNQKHPQPSEPIRYIKL